MPSQLGQWLHLWGCQSVVFFSSNTTEVWIFFQMTSYFNYIFSLNIIKFSSFQNTIVHFLHFTSKSFYSCYTLLKDWNNIKTRQYTGTCTLYYIIGIPIIQPGKLADWPFVGVSCGFEMGTISRVTADGCAVVTTIDPGFGASVTPDVDCKPVLMGSWTLTTGLIGASPLVVTTPEENGNGIQNLWQLYLHVLTFSWLER